MNKDVLCSDCPARWPDPAVPPMDKAEGVKEQAALRQQVFVLIDEFWQAVAHAYCERGHMSEKGIAARKALRQAIIDLSGFEGQA